MSIASTALASTLWLPSLPAHAQRWVVAPAAEALASDITAIRLKALPATAELTLDATRTVREWDDSLRTYRAAARFRTSAEGTLDLARAEPLPGSSYSGTDLQGPFWSMQPDTRVRQPGDLPPVEQVQLSVAHGDTVLARQTLRMLRSLPAVQEREAAPFVGARFAVLPGNLPRPALILLGGSEGGSNITRHAAVFASRGYAVLALPYYSPPGWGANGPTAAELPSLPAAFADIPLERLDQAWGWLAQQPEVDAGRIGVVGTSKGAEFALLAAVRMPWIKAVIAMVPTDVVWEGWGLGVVAGARSGFAWQGQALPFVPYEGFEQETAGFAIGAPVRLRRLQDAGRAAHPQRAVLARIPVERITAALMVVGGLDDQV